jgi:Amt family ammonium transporter
MTMIGASLLWVGWFGFNAGSNLEANGVTAVAFINTFVATCGGGRLGADRAGPSRQAFDAGCGHWRCCRSGRHHPGLRLRRADDLDPAGLRRLADLLLLRQQVKNKLGYDDTSTCSACTASAVSLAPSQPAIVADPALGGQGFFDYTQFPAGVGAYDMAAQLITQVKAVALTLVWSGVGSAVLFFIIDKTIGLRPSAEDEQQGLDLTSHGERAYNM